MAQFFITPTQYLAKITAYLDRLARNRKAILLYKFNTGQITFDDMVTGSQQIQLTAKNIINGLSKRTLLHQYPQLEFSHEEENQLIHNIQILGANI
jgi:hypothetical protein